MATPGAAGVEPARRCVRAKGELELCPAVECVRERLGGQNGQFTRVGPHVKAPNLLTPSGWWMEWYRGQNEKTRWYIGVSELFGSMDVGVNFCNGIHVKAFTF